MATSGQIVAVIGATGRQGGAVTRHLLSDGWRVRAVTRKPSGKAAQRLAELGAEVVRADMTDPESLRRAFDNAYGVYSVQNFMVSGLDGEIQQGKNVADAAKHARVQHVVHGSAGVGVPTGVGSWDAKLAVEEHMRALDLPTTVLRPSAFMELMTDRQLYPSAVMWHLMPKFMGADRPVLWLAVDDLGAVAARVFGDHDRYVGADLKLVADIRSNTECREIWRSVTGREPRRFPMPEWMFRRFVGPDLITMWTWLRDHDWIADPAETYDIVPTASTVQTWLARERGTSAETS